VIKCADKHALVIVITPTPVRLQLQILPVVRT